MMGSGTKYPAWTHQVHFDYILVTFTICPHFAHPNIHQVHVEYFQKVPSIEPAEGGVDLPLGSFWLILQFAHNSLTQTPTGHMLSIFTKCPPRYLPIDGLGTFKKYPPRTQWVNVGWIMSETLDSFHNSHQKVPSRNFVKEPLGFFQKSPCNVLIICLNHLLWVCWGFVQKVPIMWSKCAKWVFIKELTMWLNFTINPQRIHQIPTGYILITWWVLFKGTQPSDQWVSGWVLCKNTQNVPSGYLGEWIVGKM